MRVLVLDDTAAAKVLRSHRGAREIRVPFDRIEELIEAFAPPASVPSPAIAEQARRNAEVREQFVAIWGALDADQIADLAGSRATNRRATASRWQAAGEIFPVAHNGRTLFPAFQFDADAGRPRPAIAHVIARLRPAGVDGWALALWWTAPHDMLAGRRPADVLAGEPLRAIEAAETDAATLG